MIKKTDLIQASFSGLMLVLAFPPFDIYPIAWIALIPLLKSIWGKKARDSFSLGVVTGFVYFGGTIYWIFNSVHFYGNIGIPLSVLLVIILSLYLSIYIGTFSLLFTFLSGHSRFPALFKAPVIWVTLEFLRTYIFPGFPWSVLGYSQYKALPLIQIADITGVYGISFLVVALNGAIYDVMAYWPRRLSRMPLIDRWPTTVGLVAFAIFLSLSLGYGLWMLTIPEHGHTIRASVTQGNIEQQNKWDTQFKNSIMTVYKRLSDSAVSARPDLIVWPESSAPFIFDKEGSFTEELLGFQKTLGSYMVLGIMMVAEAPGNTENFSNSVLLLSPGGEVMDRYDKIHLVPFGEYVPLRRFLPFIEKLTVGIGDFVPGREYTVMETPMANISTPVCYEIIFPGLVRKFVNRGADLIVTVTNDAWFGRSSAPYQHFSMAVLRAVENRVPVVRAANTGISGFIDAKGRIRIKSDIFVESVLTEDVTIGGLRRSLYSQYGDLFAFFCIISCVLLIANHVYTGDT